MLRIQLLVLAVLSCSAAQAEIFRWVDENGHVQFSDRWNPSAEKVRIPKPAPPPEAAPATTAAVTAAAAPARLPEPASADTPFPGPYAQMEILAPAANEMLTVSADGVGVSLMVEPPLIEGQQMTLVLDEVELPVAKGTTQFRLTGTALGSHRLQLRVTGGDGRVVAQSAPVNFHIQRPKQPGELR